MIFIVLTFGAPVMDAQGKSAAKISVSEASVFARTVDVICQSVGYFSTVNNSGTWTLPDFRNAPQIVADHIHDHDVLGAILFRLFQRLRLFLILRVWYRPR